MLYQGLQTINISALRACFGFENFLQVMMFVFFYGYFYIVGGGSKSHHNLHVRQVMIVTVVVGCYAVWKNFGEPVVGYPGAFAHDVFHSGRIL